MKISNETKVGILATFAIVIVVLGVNFLRGNNLFSKSVTYYAKFKDVGGLSASNPVMLYGVKIGQVDGLNFINIGLQDTMVLLKMDADVKELGKQFRGATSQSQKDSLNRLMNDIKNRVDKLSVRVEVRFHVDGDVHFPANSIAKINSELLGSKTLEIVPGNSKMLAAKSDTLKGAVELSLPEALSKTVSPIKDKVETLVSSIDTVVNSLNDIFNDQTKKDLKRAFSSIGPTIKNIENTTAGISSFMTSEEGRFRDIIVNLDKISQNVNSYNGPITRIIDNLAGMTDTVRALNFKKTITDANNSIASINEILTNVKNGNGTIGKLLKDDKLYYDLVSATRHFDQFIFDLKNNPRKYLAPLGKTNKSPAPYAVDTAKSK